MKTAQTATDEPEKLDLRSFDIPGEKRAQFLALFPEARTEGSKVDFDRLKLALGETVDVGRERYGMNWPGKADCFRTIQTPSVGTLLPAPNESVNFNNAENVIIKGDNLEVLKLLQKSYLGKIKMFISTRRTTRETSLFTLITTVSRSRRTWNTQGKLMPKARSSAQMRRPTAVFIRNG